MSTLTAIKTKAIQGDLKGALKGLLLWVKTNRVDYIDTTTNIIRELNELELNQVNGVISSEDFRVEKAKISQRFLQLIDLLDDKILGNNSRFQAYHSFTCDRVEQMKFFSAIYKDQLLDKIQFYYIYGLDLQSHTGMFQRISYHLEDLLSDHLDPLFQKKSDALRVQISSMDVDNDLNIYKENVLKKIFRSFSIDVNIHNDLLTKDLSFIVENSPQVKGLTAQDYVCVFLGITDRDWDKDQTPIMAHWFIKEFCEVQFPADSPRFLFFFGIMYEDNDSAVKKEVIEVMKNPLLAKPLPELAMVKETHIKDWFDEYAKFFPKVRERKNIIKNTLQNLDEYKEGEAFFMEDIQDELEKIIDKVNEDLLNK